jgi:hypothetical protein
MRMMREKSTRGRQKSLSCMRNICRQFIEKKKHASNNVKINFVGRVREMRYLATLLYVKIS